VIVDDFFVGSQIFHSVVIVVSFHVSKSSRVFKKLTADQPLFWCRMIETAELVETTEIDRIDDSGRRSPYFVFQTFQTGLSISLFNSLAP
jgi:hypothetical protein